jgi:hypothetical protein
VREVVSIVKLNLKLHLEVMQDMDVTTSPYRPFRERTQAKVNTEYFCTTRITVTY